MSVLEPEPVLHCPLCNGPLRQEGDMFACVIDHKSTSAEVVRHTELRLAEALWMAVEALDSEAMMLRLLSDSPDAVQLAADAEAQRELLRQFGRRRADAD